jgi:hypothetical protein
LAVSLGIFLVSDKLLKKAFVAASIKFPSALFGMFCVFSVLTVVDLVVPAAATGLMNFFEPATLFIQRYLPLFYVPSLVVLPLAVRDVPAASGLKICFIIGLCYYTTYLKDPIQMMVKGLIIYPMRITKKLQFSFSF